MNNSNITQPDLPIKTGQNSCRQQNEISESHKSHGSNGGKNDLAKAWMYTPSATESRTVLKQVIIDGLGSGSVSEDHAKSLFSKYDLAGL